MTSTSEILHLTHTVSAAGGGKTKLRDNIVETDREISGGMKKIAEVEEELSGGMRQFSD